MHVGTIGGRNPFHQRRRSPRTARLLALTLLVPAVALSCTPTSTPNATAQEIHVLSMRELYPIALERAEEELGDVALLRADLFVAPIQSAGFAFLSVENPTESALVPFLSGTGGREVTTKRFSTEEPRSLGNTIQPEEWQGVDSGEAFQIAYEAEGRAMVEKYGQTGLWFIVLDFVEVGDGIKLGWRVSFDLPNGSRLDVMVEPQTGEILFSRIVGDPDSTLPR